MGGTPATDLWLVARTLVLVLLAATTALAFALSVRSALAPSVVSEDEIHALLVDHVDLQKKSLGTVIGTLTDDGRRIHSYGRRDEDDPRPLDGDTVFEIGSMTKIFTALLLADMVQRGEVALDDPLSSLLPDVRIPERSGRRITLLDLATHTSGLPFFPSDIPLDDPAEVARIVADYPVDRVHRFLAGYELPPGGGTKWTYSNLGYALLGEALARRAGTEYEALVRERITGPLGMESTAFALSPELRARLASGHDAKLRPAPEVAMPAFVPAAGLRSTANDLLTLLEAFTGRRPSPLAPAMARMLQTRRPGPGFEQALGWWRVKLGPDDPGFIAFGGQTAGFATTVAFDPETHAGVVVLSNGAQDDGGLGWHLLRPGFPVATAAALAARRERVGRAVTLEGTLLERCVGQYRVASGPTAGDLITIDRRPEGLGLRSPATPPEGVRLYAEDRRTFFLGDADVKITFDLDGQGSAKALTVRFAGIETPAERVETRGERR